MVVQGNHTFTLPLGREVFTANKGNPKSQALSR